MVYRNAVALRGLQNECDAFEQAAMHFDSFFSNAWILMSSNSGLLSGLIVIVGCRLVVSLTNVTLLPAIAQRLRRNRWWSKKSNTPMPKLKMSLEIFQSNPLEWVKIGLSHDKLCILYFCFLNLPGPKSARLLTACYVTGGLASRQASQAGSSWNDGFLLLLKRCNWLRR